jgi:hypothetical protein
VLPRSAPRLSFETGFDRAFGKIFTSPGHVPVQLRGHEQQLLGPVSVDDAGGDQLAELQGRFVERPVTTIAGFHQRP